MSLNHGGLFSLKLRPTSELIVIFLPPFSDGQGEAQLDSYLRQGWIQATSCLHLCQVGERGGGEWTGNRGHIMIHSAAFALTGTSGYLLSSSGVVDRPRRRRGARGRALGYSRARGP